MEIDPSAHWVPADPQPLIFTDPMLNILLNSRNILINSSQIPPLELTYSVQLTCQPTVLGCGKKL